MQVKTPIGLRPESIAIARFNYTRLQELHAAINRYYAAQLPIPLEWSDELTSRLAEQPKPTEPFHYAPAELRDVLQKAC